MRGMAVLLSGSRQARQPQEPGEINTNGGGDKVELRERGNDAPLFPSRDGTRMDLNARRQLGLRKSGPLAPVDHSRCHLIDHDSWLRDMQLRVKQNCATRRKTWV